MNNHFRTLEELTARLQHLRGMRVTWHKIAAMDEFGGSSAGLLCNVLLNGYEPKSPLTRKKLNLPPLAVPVAPCPDCSEVHIVGYCTKLHGEPQRPKPPTKRKRHQIRLAASVTKEERELLREMAAGYGMTWTEACQALANGRFILIEPKEG